MVVLGWNDNRERWGIGSSRSNNLHSEKVGMQRACVCVCVCMRVHACMLSL